VSKNIQLKTLRQLAKIEHKISGLNDEIDIEEENRSILRQKTEQL
jgi:hypothetical protein